MSYNIDWTTIEHVLYASSGSTDDITLSESAANYDYVEIFYYDNASPARYGSARVYGANGKRVSISIVSGGIIKMRTMALSGTSLTSDEYGEFNCTTKVYSSGAIAIRVYRVVGYNV